MGPEQPPDAPAPVFIGRAWLVAAVRDWTVSPARYLFITGLPGTGKSAAVDHLWDPEHLAGDGSVAVYRCRATDRRSCDPVRFAESLADQFSGMLPGFTDALMRVSTELSGRPGEIHIEGSASAETVEAHGSVIGVRVSITNVTADEAFDRLVVRPLERLAPQVPPIVVIDALDEALTYRAHRTIAEIVLDGTPGVPLRFVITSRHDARVVAAKDRIEGATSLDLVDDAPDADLFEYTLHRLQHLVVDDAERAALAWKVARRGAGNYLYVYHLTEELIAGARAVGELDDVAVLPSGLEDLYLQFLRREIRPIGNAVTEERWRREFRPVLSLLVSGQEDGFTAAQIAEILDSSEQTVIDVVDVLGQYLLGASRGPWRLYHRSFADFLLRGPDAQLDAAEGHRRIADYAFAQWPDAWDTCDDPYYLRHLPDHLMMALECPTVTRAQVRTLRDRLYALATSEAYLDAQQTADPGRDPHLATVALALESSLSIRAYGRVTRLALALAHAQAATDAVTPVQAALAWGSEAGAAKARSYPADVSLIWHLLIMVAFALEGRGEARSMATTIQRSGFSRIDKTWSAAAAALVAPLLPALGSELFDAVRGVADDTMLSYLALFLLEGIAPGWSIVPAICIDEVPLRARAITEIFMRIVLDGEHLDGLPELGDAVMKNFTHRQEETDRVLGLTHDSEFKSYLLMPEVPDAVLVAEAARGRFEQARQELTNPEGPYHYRTSADAVFVGMIVDAILHGGAAEQRLREAGEQALGAQPGYLWTILHYTNYLHSIEDPRVPELLNRIIELSHADDDDDYVWEMYKGHVDAFHGRCDVGLWLAVVRALCDAARTADARAVAERLRDAHPAERIRALAYVRNVEPDADRASEDEEAARQTAAEVPDDMHAQAMLILVDGRLDQLLDTVAGSLARSRGTIVRLSGTVLATLAWAAHLRDDHDHAAILGGKASEHFAAIPEKRRSARNRNRIVKGLLRARLPEAAAATLAIPTTHVGSRLLRLPDDVQHDLIMSGELRELAMLRQALGEPSQPAGDALESRAMLVRLLRAADDQVGLAEARAAASHSLENAMRRMRKDIRRQRRSYYDSYDCEAEAAKLALLAADLGRPAYAADAVDLMNAWASQAEMASASWDAFRGYFPRSDEMRQDSDNQYTRRSHLVAHLAEAFHRAGDAEQAATWFQRAREFADGVRTPGRRARAFVALAEIAARCGWFATMQAVLPEATAVRGTELGSVAEILAVTVRQGRTDADGARDALDTLLLSKTLTHLDHLDILSQLAVLSLDPAVEVQLLAASTEAPAVPSDG